MTRGIDGPLFAWGEALRAARRRRRMLVRRGGTLALGIAVLGGTIVAPPGPRIVWNASNSAPVGLYIITYGTTIRSGSTVLAWAPEVARDHAARRHYLPRNVPLIKRVEGVPGVEICALGPTIYRDGAPLAPRRAMDGRGRPLPWWTGCRRLRDGEYFLLNRSADSFDGRYFGVTRTADIIGKAHRL